MRKLIVGIIWFLILYFGACAITGAIAGGRAANQLPEETSQEWVNQVAATAAMEMVIEVRAYFLAGALAIVIVGSILGILPGTHPDAATGHSARDAGVEPVDAPVGLTKTGDLYRRRNDAR
jgi:hypothetical protein